MSEPIELLANYCAFDGWQKQYRHPSQILHCPMTFSIYLPPQTNTGKTVPVVYWLSGLTCNDENFSTKAGAQRIAADLGLALVIPDTSPRGENVPDAEDQAYDLGLGAGFYLNATKSPWSRHYQMYDYITKELPILIEQTFPVTSQRAISGHSLGGHGALIVALKNPDRYISATAFSPIVNPIQCPWGKKVFSNYLGYDKESWKAWDATELLLSSTNNVPILIDQGTEDSFLKEQLLTENFISASKTKHYPAQINYRQDYDHSYYFIASFIDQHLRFHAQYFDF